jgi:hypothetical protein
MRGRLASAQRARGQSPWGKAAIAPAGSYTYRAFGPGLAECVRLSDVAAVMRGKRMVSRARERGARWGWAGAICAGIFVLLPSMGARADYSATATQVCVAAPSASFYCDFSPAYAIGHTSCRVEDESCVCMAAGVPNTCSSRKKSGPPTSSCGVSYSCPSGGVLDGTMCRIAYPLVPVNCETLYPRIPGTSYYCDFRPAYSAGHTGCQVTAQACVCIDRGGYLNTCGVCRISPGSCSGCLPGQTQVGNACVGEPADGNCRLR